MIEKKRELLIIDCYLIFEIFDFSLIGGSKFRQFVNISFKEKHILIIS